ncbi:branched-chain amino acid ABC transporter substrate-binding protein, partial [Burkholderia sp. BCC1970]
MVMASIGASSLASAASTETVKIGAALALTGGLAHLGKDSESGARLAVEETNAKGLTINGKNVVLVLDSQDDGGDPRTATQVAQKLADDKVIAVVGHQTSGTSIPASKIYSDAGIVQISPAATNPLYTQQGFKTTYRLMATDAQQGPALATFAAKQLGAKTVAVVDDATAYGQG